MYLVTLVLLSFLLGSCGRHRAPAEPVDDVYIYLIDALRWDHLGCYGHPRDISPHIDAFAADAFVFTHARTASPWTRPAVAGIFTGLTPRLHGTRGRAGSLAHAFLTWPEAMQKLGYRTVAVVTNRNVSSVFGFDQGFEFFDMVTRPGADYIRSDQLHEDWLPFLDLPTEGRPVFHYLHTIDPHFPYRPLPRFQRNFQDGLQEKLAERADPQHRNEAARFLDQYDQEILQNDDSFGRFLQALKDRGLYRDSWIVVVSDHGEEFWEHGLYGHGNSLHENLLRVPLIVHPPGGRSGPWAKTMERLARQPFPTHALADLIGPRVSRRWEPLARHNARMLGLTEKEIAANLPRPGHLIPPDNWASYLLDGRGGTALVEGTRKLQWEDLPEPGWVFFDLRSDPQETVAVRLEIPSTDTALRPLQERITAWSDRTARGLHLRWEGPEPAPPLRILCRQGLREAYLRPGVAPRRFLLREGGTVAWRPVDGAELFLVGRPDALWQISVGNAPVRTLWPRPSHPADKPTGLQVEWKDFGREILNSEATVDPSRLPEELQRHLRALGYIH